MIINLDYKLTDLAREIGLLLIKHKLSLGVVESATGGLVSNAITNIPVVQPIFRVRLPATPMVLSKVCWGCLPGRFQNRVRSARKPPVRWLWGGGSYWEQISACLIRGLPGLGVKPLASRWGFFIWVCPH